jgi:hypothetical protein
MRHFACRWSFYFALQRVLAVYRAADASKVAPEGIVCKIVGVKANGLVAVIQGKQLG